MKEYYLRVSLEHLPELYHPFWIQQKGRGLTKIDHIRFSLNSDIVYKKLKVLKEL